MLFWDAQFKNVGGMWQSVYRGWDEGQARAAGAWYVTRGFAVGALVWDTDNPHWTFQPWSQASAPSDDESAPLPPEPAPDSWKSLPVDGDDVPIKAGLWYRVAALVKNNHTDTEIKAQATNRGLIVVSYEAKAGSYREIRILAYASRDGGMVPTHVPSPLSWVDDSHMTRLEYAPPGGKKAPPLVVRAGGGFPWGLAVGGVAVAGGGALVWRYRKEIARWWSRRAA